jgi:hypothetical protein
MVGGGAASTIQQPSATVATQARWSNWRASFGSAVNAASGHLNEVDVRYRYAAVVAVVWLLLVLGRAENLTITAHEEIKTYVLKDGVAELAPAVIPSGTVLAGTGCEDLKHYTAVQVKYKGQTLYLLEGDYRLDRLAFLRSWKLPLVFRCP